MQSNSNALKKWSWRLLWLTGGLVSIWVLAWATVPWVIKSQLQKGVSDQLGRKATIGEIDFKPWTLELTINDLAIASQDGASAQFTLKRLYANAEIESLLRLAPVLQTLVVEGPRLKLARTGNGTYDIDDILARLAKREPAGTNNPLRFALFNLSLSGGTLDFDDKPVSRVHQLRDLSLSVPFLSNLESRREIKVEPRLAFSFNGSRFDSSAQATPFLPSQKTDAIINLRNFDLAPYLPYIPSGVPLRLQRAMLGADLKLAFEQSGKPVVKLSGVVQVSGVKVADANTRELLAFDGLKLTLDDLRPLDRVAKIAGIELTAPSFTVQRDEAGRINWQLGSGHAENVVAATPATPASATVPALASSDWKVEVARFVVRDGTANWSDAAITPKANLQARELSLDATGIAWPLAQPVEFRGTFAVSEKASTALAAATDSKPAKGRLAASPSSGADAHLIFSGTATDQQATVKASLQSASLALASPYLALFLEPAMHGKLNAELELNWKAPELQLDIQSLTLDDLALVGAAQQGKPVNADKAALASIRKISVSQARIDLAERTVSVGKLAVDQPRFAVVRGQDNHWMFERWLKAPALGSEMAAPSATSAVATKAMAAKKPMAARPGKSMAAAAAPAPWSVVIGDLALDGGVVSYLDQASSKPVALEISALNVLMKDAKLDGNRPSRVQVSGRIAAERGQPGQFDYRGTLQMQPMVVQGNVVARRIPLHGFEPYFGAGLNIELLRADASFKGDLRYAQLPGGPSVKVSGDSALEDFRANSIAANDGGLKIAEELLNWKALNLRGLDLALSPGSPTMIAVKETTLSDFFARVIIHEDGRINLQDIVKADTPPDAAAPAIAASAPAGTPTPAPGARIAAGQGANATSPGAPEPVIDIGPISLINGKVLFSDRFVKPNYSANLSELTGKLSAFSSVVPQGQPRLADLELRGRAEGTASLEILGKLNPLAKPLALDIKGKVRDLELSPLSPYSVKYAGYGITRGKLSVDVAYLVLPDGQLTASNKLVLNQLTFGDKVEGAPNSLPVKLAVALLADRNGVIDIDLPVSGSLNDPQFRLGPIIFKVIVNLIVKAITAPFSLLASAFGGGGDELSVVGFAPGSAVLSQPAKDGLDKVAKALAERPALKMTVVGTSSLGAEREAYKHERLLALLKAEKRRVLVTVGSAQDAAAPLEVSDADIPALLKEVYQRADMPKPPNALGVAKEVTPQEMEALLMANITATEEAMRELALLRGVVVRDYLASRQLALERLFLGAVKTVAEDPKWSPRAELSLANN